MLRMSATKRLLSFFSRIRKSFGCADAKHAPELPQSPREMLRGREVYERPLLNRPYRISPEHDTPLRALYRLYEHIMLDQNIEMRNELEYFWFQSSWLVQDIPDSKDPDPERYAVLAVIPALLVLAFNERIGLGLPRDAPAIFTYEQLDEWRAQDRAYEKEPEWATAVPPCKEPLQIPHWDNKQRQFVPLDGFESEKASQEFAKKNILIWQPHIYFI